MYWTERKRLHEGRTIRKLVGLVGGGGGGEGGVVGERAKYKTNIRAREN